MLKKTFMILSFFLIFISCSGDKGEENGELNIAFQILELRDQLAQGVSVIEKHPQSAVIDHWLEQIDGYKKKLALLEEEAGIKPKEKRPGLLAFSLQKSKDQVIDFKKELNTARRKPDLESIEILEQLIKSEEEIIRELERRMFWHSADKRFVPGAKNPEILFQIVQKLDSLINDQPDHERFEIRKELFQNYKKLMDPPFYVMMARARAYKEREDEFYKPSEDFIIDPYKRRRPVRKRK